MIGKKSGRERVRANTPDVQNSEIDQQIIQNLRAFAGKSNKEISDRITKLDQEWDIERVLSMNMSIIAIIGIGLALFVNMYWVLLPLIVLIFYFQHAVQGWCPPLVLFRRFKIRTRPEIDREKYALKALRGDFYGIQNANVTADLAFEVTKRN